MVMAFVLRQSLQTGRVKFSGFAPGKQQKRTDKHPDWSYKGNFATAGVAYFAAKRASPADNSRESPKVACTMAYHRRS
jgi:hypothetical protein